MEKRSSGYWYKLEFTAGKGHARTEIKYYWSDYKMSNKDQDILWNDWTREFSYERMWNGHVKFIDKLPDDVKTQLLNNYQQAIDSANKMINIIKEN